MDKRNKKSGDKLRKLADEIVTEDMEVFKTIRLSAFELDQKDEKIRELEEEIEYLKEYILTVQKEKSVKRTSDRMEKVLKRLEESPIPPVKVTGGWGLPDLSRRKPPRSKFVKLLHNFLFKSGK